MPGAVTKNQRAIWQVGDLEVHDGGADGLASTTGDNTLFEVQGWCLDPLAADLRGACTPSLD